MYRQIRELDQESRLRFQDFQNPNAMHLDPFYQQIVVSVLKSAALATGYDLSNFSNLEKTRGAIAPIHDFHKILEEKSELIKKDSCEELFWANRLTPLPFTRYDEENLPQSQLAFALDFIIKHLDSAELIEDIASGNGTRMLELVRRLLQSGEKRKLGIVCTDINKQALEWGRLTALAMGIDRYFLWGVANAALGPVSSGYPKKQVMACTLFTHFQTESSLSHLLRELRNGLKPSDRCVIQFRIQDPEFTYQKRLSDRPELERKPFDITYGEKELPMNFISLKKVNELLTKASLTETDGEISPLDTLGNQWKLVLAHPS